MADIRFQSDSDVVCICGSFNEWKCQKMNKVVFGDFGDFGDFGEHPSSSVHSLKYHSLKLMRTHQPTHHFSFFISPTKPYFETVQFKFVINGLWQTSTNYGTVKDSSGNENNTVVLNPSLVFPYTETAKLVPQNKCPQCSHSFSTDVLPTIPCLLSCGHSICYWCIGMHEKEKGSDNENGKERENQLRNIECPQCQELSKPSFSVNWRMMSQLYEISVFTEQRKFYSKTSHVTSPLIKSLTDDNYRILRNSAGHQFESDGIIRCASLSVDSETESETTKEFKKKDKKGFRIRKASTEKESERVDDVNCIQSFLVDSVASYLPQDGFSPSQSSPSSSSSQVHSRLLENSLLGIGTRNRMKLNKIGLYEEDMEKHEKEDSKVIDQKSSPFSKFVYQSSIYKKFVIGIPFGFSISPLSFEASPPIEEMNDSKESISIEITDAKSSSLRSSKGASSLSTQFWTFEYCESYPQFYSHWKRKHLSHSHQHHQHLFHSHSHFPHPFQNHLSPFKFFRHEIPHLLDCFPHFGDEENGNDTVCDAHQKENFYFCYDHLTPICATCLTSIHCGHFTSPIPKAAKNIKYCLLKMLHSLKRSDELLCKRALFFKCVLNNLRLIENEQSEQINAFYDSLKYSFSSTRAKDLRNVSFQSNGAFFKNRFFELKNISARITEFDDLLTRLYHYYLPNGFDFSVIESNEVTLHIQSIRFMFAVFRDNQTTVSDLVERAKRLLNTPQLKIPIAVKFFPQEDYDLNSTNPPSNFIIPVEYRVPMVSESQIRLFPPTDFVETESVDYDEEIIENESVCSSKDGMSIADLDEEGEEELVDGEEREREEREEREKERERGSVFLENDREVTPEQGSEHNQIDVGISIPQMSRTRETPERRKVWNILFGVENETDSSTSPCPNQEISLSPATRVRPSAFPDEFFDPSPNL